MISKRALALEAVNMLSEYLDNRIGGKTQKEKDAINAITDYLFMADQPGKKKGGSSMAQHIVDAVAWQEACNGVHCFDCPFMQDTFCKIKQYIESQPEADPPLPHGEWVIRGDNTFITCNKCGYVKGVNCIYFRTRFEPLPNFCENCGADMRREPAP